MSIKNFFKNLFNAPVQQSLFQVDTLVDTHENAQSIVPVVEQAPKVEVLHPAIVSFRRSYEMLNLSPANIAKVLDISKGQAYYWLRNNSRPHKANIKNIEDLEVAACMLTAAGIYFGPEHLEKKFNGKNFLEHVRFNGSIEASAIEFVKNAK